MNYTIKPIPTLFFLYFFGWKTIIFLIVENKCYTNKYYEIAMLFFFTIKILSTYQILWLLFCYVLLNNNFDIDYNKLFYKKHIKIYDQYSKILFNNFEKNVDLFFDILYDTNFGKQIIDNYKILIKNICYNNSQITDVNNDNIQITDVNNDNIQITDVNNINKLTKVSSYTNLNNLIYNNADVNNINKLTKVSSYTNHNNYIKNNDIKNNLLDNNTEISFDDNEYDIDLILKKINMISDINTLGKNKKIILKNKKKHKKK
jgi:hypothetical protein